MRFGGGEIHETAFEHIEGNFISGGEELRELPSVGSGRLALFDLRDAFVHPGGAAVAGHLRDERVRQFVFEDAGQLGRDALDAADRDAQLAIIDGAAPGGRTGDVENRLLGVERDGDVVVGRVAEIAYQVVILGVEGREQVAAEGLGGVLAFEVEIEVNALALRKIGFGARFALSASQVLANRRIGTQGERLLPRANGLGRMIAGELNEAQHGDGIG